MTYSYAYAAPKRFQWETNSAPSQSENCGPTCITQIAGFYKDRSYGIESTRRLIAAPQTPTHAWQQRDMLIARGVPATVRVIESLAELHGLVDTGRRPVLIGLLDSRVPDGVRGHPFEGWHAVTVLGRAVVNGQNGFWITDPNFSPPGGIRPDPAHGSRFYSDGIIQWAYIANSPRYAVVPNSLKALPTATPQQYVRFNADVDGVRIRRGPDARVANIVATAWKDPTGIRSGQQRNGRYITATSSRLPSYATVGGPDGQPYKKIRLPGSSAYVYVQSRFVHGVV